MDKKYCIYCGTQNSPQAEFCTKCGKEMNPTENLFIDFLVKRTKDKFKDEAETSVYEALKNFLLSHLYGVMLTISFVSAVAVTGYASEPYIQKIDNRYLETFNSSFNRYEGIDDEYPMEYNIAIHDLITHYETEAMNEVLRDARGNMVTPDPDRYRLPASMGYGGQHQLNPSIPTYIEGTNSSGTKHRTEFDPEFYQRDISRRLAADGYTVGECLIEAQFESDGQIVASYEYMLVAVLVDDQWLVAEDVIISMDNIEQQPQEEPTEDIDTFAAHEVAADYMDAVFTGGDGSYLLMSDALGYSTVHQMVYDPELPLYTDGVDSETLYQYHLKTSEFINPVSATLRSDGYTVVEYFAQQTLFDMNDNYRVMGVREFCITCVEIDGQWYVAEDTLISREYGDSNEDDMAAPVINIDEVSELAKEYTDLIFTGNDASHLRISSDFGYNGKHLLVYYAPLDFDSAVVNSTREYGVHTLPDGFRNDVTLSIMNDGYTVAEYWARDEFTDKSTGRILGYREYCVTCVLIDGQWCVAEDIGIASEVY